MIINPGNVNPNSVRVGMVRIRRRCVKTQFSTAYPARLNGVISQGEFRESIDNINSKIPSTKAQIFCIVIVIICLIVGIWLLLASISISKGTAASVFMIFIGVGIGLTAFGAVFLPLGCHVLHIQRTKRLRQVVAEESKKYWSRSAERCNWRLEVTRVLTRCFVRRVYVYHIIIDNIQDAIVRNPNEGLFPQPVTPSANAILYLQPVTPNANAGLYPQPVIPSANAILYLQPVTPSANPLLYPQPVTPNVNARLYPQPVTPRPTPSVPPPDDMPPPPYPGEPVQFCSQCGLLRPDLNAKFCVSCGHAYNR